MEIDAGLRSSLFSGREPGGPFSEIVASQWSFSPQGSTSEIEDYQVNLATVSILELAIKPDSPPDLNSSAGKVAH